MKYFLILNLAFCLQLAPSSKPKDFLKYRVIQMNCNLESCHVTLQGSLRDLSIHLKPKDTSFKVGDILFVKQPVFLNNGLGDLESMVVRLSKDKPSIKLKSTSQVQAKSFLQQHHPSSDYLLF